MEDALAVLVSQVLGDRSIREGSQICHLPDYLLRDVVYKKTRRPAPSTLKAISTGFGISYERLALAAYGILASEDYEGDGVTLPDGPPPSETDAQWTQPDKRKLSAVT